MISNSTLRNVSLLRCYLRELLIMSYQSGIKYSIGLMDVDKLSVGDLKIHTDRLTSLLRSTVPVQVKS